MRALTIDEAKKRLENRRIVRIIDHKRCDEYYEYDNPEAISKLTESYKEGSVEFSYNPTAEKRAHEIMHEIMQ